jgi:phosphopantetheine adenylyltransferase
VIFPGKVEKMDGIEKRLEQVHQLIAAIKENRDEMVAIAVQDTGFTRRECNLEIDIVLNRLQGFDEMVTPFAQEL